MGFLTKNNLINTEYMKNGNEIWGTFIVPVNKATNVRIKNLHYAMNQILYDNNKRYISPISAKRILDKLIELGVSLKELNVENTYKPKKEEILSRLREICKSLIKYRKNYMWTEDDAIQINNTLKYQVKMYIDEKDKETMNVINFLKRNREIWEEMYVPYPNKELINTKHFVEMQTELKQKSLRHDVEG